MNANQRKWDRFVIAFLPPMGANHRKFSANIFLSVSGIPTPFAPPFKHLAWDSKISSQ
ncbi:MAG: hypothetical protein KZQ97_09675 [Candidatus Thiodiazotropha sp. (ex Dulcina madagascariensis)]|nr:hypothetical protein [Candidatus Thiodiazotropha sp. (ex Dulcina madagascariensis)]